MMLGVAPISASLVDKLPQAGPVPAVGGQAQFQRELVQTVAAGPQEAVQAAATSAAPVMPASEVPRATTQPDTLGERILQNLSAVHRAGAASSPTSIEASAVKGVQPGPAEQSLLQPGGSAGRMPGKPQGADNFEAMIASLQNVYSNVIQVSLVSKSTGSFSSSLNKLMSAG